MPLQCVNIPSNEYINNQTFKVGECAFSDCKYLKEVTIPEENIYYQNLGENVFENSILTLDVLLNEENKFVAKLPNAIVIDSDYNESEVEILKFINTDTGVEEYSCQLNDDNSLKIDDDGDGIYDENIVTIENNNLEKAGIKVVKNSTYGSHGLLDGLTIKFSRGNVELSGIIIEQQPIKKVYFEGDEFDKTGMVVKAIYNNGDEVQLREEEYEVTPQTLSLGDTFVTVSYGEQTAQVTEITVTPILLESIEIRALPNDTYFVGDVFDSEGIIVIAHYNNGTEKDITDSPSLEIYPSLGTTLTLNPTTVTVTYTEQYEGAEPDRTRQATRNIAVNPIELVKIRITQKPTKQAYIEGEDIDLSRNGSYSFL